MYKMSKDANYSLITRMLLDSGASVAHRDRQGRTYLMHALDAGDFESAKALVSRGIDVNAADQSGTTALMCVMKGALTGAQIASMCEMLLAKGANPGVRNVSKMTAYEMAASQKDRETREAGVKALGRVKGR
jgi:ankyrin repeat protein